MNVVFGLVCLIIALWSLTDLVVDTDRLSVGEVALLTFVVAGCSIGAFINLAGVL